MQHFSAARGKACCSVSGGERGCACATHAAALGQPAAPGSSAGLPQHCPVTHPGHGGAAILDPLSRRQVVHPVGVRHQLRGGPLHLPRQLVVGVEAPRLGMLQPQAARLAAGRKAGQGGEFGWRRRRRRQGGRRAGLAPRLRIPRGYSQQELAHDVVGGAPALEQAALLLDGARRFVGGRLEVEAGRHGAGWNSVVAKRHPQTQNEPRGSGCHWLPALLPGSVSPSSGWARDGDGPGASFTKHKA